LAALLLDANALLWFFWDDRRLSVHARQIIEDSQNIKWVSLATCWEIAIKSGLGKLNLGEPAGGYLNRELATNHFELLPITFDNVAAVESLPRHHGDPFDRLLIAQAISLPAAIVSSDRALDQYGVARAW
jgi:PIN domain nuclease of toxin-antitoxin system